MSDLKKALLGGLASAALLALAWKRLFLLGELPLDGNMIGMSYPDWALSRAGWAGPHWPLWDPLKNLGEPLLADPQSMALYPLFWLYGWAGDFLSSLRLFVLLHSFLAAGFMGALVWRWKKDLPAACAAAAAAAFNGFFMGRLTLAPHFAAAAWLPAVLYFQVAGSATGLGVCLAMQWLAGFPPFALLGALSAAAVAAAQGREGLRRLALGGLLGGCLAAAQGLPFLEMLRLSERSLVLGSTAARVYAEAPAQLLKLLFVPQWAWLSPMVQGDPAIVGFYLGLPLMLLGLWSLKDGMAERKIAVGALACLLFSLGWGLPLHVFRFPANWLLPAASALILLGASGLARLPERFRWAAAGLVVLDLLVFAQAPRTAWSRPGFLEDPPELSSSLAFPARVLHTERLRRTWEQGSLNETEDYMLMRDFLAPSFGTAFGAAEADSYQVLRSSAASRFQRRLAQSQGRRELLSLAGVSKVVDLAPGAMKVERAALQVTEAEKPPRPRAFLLDPRSGRVELEAYRPGRVALRVEAGQAATLVLAETAYPGWRAKLDGRKLKTGTFEDVFVSLTIPEGRHEVLLYYSPDSFRLGLFLSLLSLCFLLGYNRGRWRGARAAESARLEIV